MLPCILLALTAVVASGHTDSRADIFLPHLYLVRAKAVSVSYNAGLFRGVFEIEHVYLGHGSLKGQRFEVSETRKGMSGMALPNWSDPEVMKGEVNIWWVADPPVVKKTRIPAAPPASKYPLVAAMDNPDTIPFVLFPPGRKGVDSQSFGDKWYKNVEKCALAMERVYRANERERIELLKQCCCRDEPILQAWSLDRLDHTLSKADYTAFLTQLASTVSLSLLMERLVDRRLSACSLEWCHSKKRLDMFQRWMTRKLSDGDVEQGEFQILDSWARTSFDGVSYPVYLSLVIDGLTATTRSDSFKRLLLETTRCFVPEDTATANTGFAYVMAQIRTAAPDRRLAAARLLIHFVPLCKDQESAVQSYLYDPASKPIATHLAAALRQTAEIWNALSAENGPKPEDPRSHRMPEPFRELARAQVVHFFRERLRPSVAVDPARIRTLVEDLDHEKFSRREAASRELARRGLEGEPILCALLGQAPSVEARRRLNDLLDQFKKERLATLHAIDLLARIKTPAARDVLEKLAKGTPHSPITRQARAALEKTKQEKP